MQPIATTLTRRSLLAGVGCATAVGPRKLFLAGTSPASILFSVKYPMVQAKGSMEDHFRLLKRIGFDGVEMESPNNYEEDEVLRISRDVGLPVHGVVNSVHWQTRLSDPSVEVREQAVQALLASIEDAHAMGGDSVLLVPGRVSGSEESAEAVEQRSIDGIRAALPTAARLGVRILIENVWNRFLYDHDGGGDQSADALTAYLDQFQSPWVGSYFDIGNHRKYAKPELWIRTLGRHIVKLDVKDWGAANGWTQIGDGDVDWALVRAALDAVRFTGWATAEVAGGDERRLEDIYARMTRCLRSSE